MNRHIVFAVLLLLLVACVDAHAQVICKGSSPVNETVERKHGQLQVTLAYSSAQGGGHMPEARRQRSLAIPNFQWLEKAVETKVPMTKPTLLIREEVNSANFVEA